MENENIISKAVVVQKDFAKIYELYEPAFDIDSVSNIRYLVGKNAENNWNIYRASERSDTIFHLDKFSSPYVIVNVPITELTTEQIYMAAYLCKLKSKYKSYNNIGVLYTSISNTSLGNEIGSFNIKSTGKKKVIHV